MQSEDEDGAAGDNGDEVAGLAGSLQNWQKSARSRALLQRVCDESVWYHEQARKTLEPSEIPELVDEAEAVKGAMAQLMPRGKLG